MWGWREHDSTSLTGLLRSDLLAAAYQLTTSKWWSMPWYRWWCLRVVVVEDQLHSRLSSWKHLECILITYSVAHMEWNSVEACIESCHVSTRSVRGGELNFCDDEGYLGRVDLVLTLKIPLAFECLWRIVLSQICHTYQCPNSTYLAHFIVFQSLQARQRNQHSAKQHNQWGQMEF